MDIPWLTERVRVRGHEGSFLVVKVDEEEQTVDVVPVSGIAECLAHVPFSELVRTDGKRT